MKIVNIIRKKWHKDIDTILRVGLHEIRSYNQNKYLIENLGEGGVKKLPFYGYAKKIHEIKIYMLPNEMQRFIRCGNDEDGGYIMGTPFSSTKIAYSFGINKDVSWDNEVADQGYDVYMYDHTIRRLPQYRKEFHWKRIGITGRDETKNLKNFETLIKENNHTNQSGMLLKMDVEGAEWDVLDMIDLVTLNRFDQIVIEMHGFLSKNNWDKVIRVIDKLDSSFNCVHIHANNCGYVEYIGDLIIADTLEMTWINSKYDMKEIEKENLILPTEIDMPCDNRLNEIVIGKW